MIYSKEVMGIRGMAIVCIGILMIVIMQGCNRSDSSMIQREEDMIYRNQLIEELVTDVARYQPSDQATIKIDLYNEADRTIEGKLYYTLYHLDQIVQEQEIKALSIEPGEKKYIEYAMELPRQDYTGYLLEVTIQDKKNVFDKATVGIDVSSDWTKFPRYGYIASYPKQDTQITENIIEELNKYHINGLQFYDWQYKHQQPILVEKDTLADEWVELANRPVYVATVEDYINRAHQYGMAAMNYNLLFGAWKDYKDYPIDPSWGLYTDREGQEQDYHPLPDDWASNRIYLFNPQNKAWQDYIIKQELDVFDYLDFDGWHVDQLGDRGKRYDALGNPINLINGYVDLLNEAHKQMGNKKIVFNAVNGYGQRNIGSKTDMDFLYTEVWSTEKYNILKKHIDDGFLYTDYQKAVVLAAYMNYRKQSGYFNEASVRYTDAVIFASGGSHIELGDGGMLSSEYFPSDKLTMSDDLKKALRKYYDFLVAYQNYLRDDVRPKYNKLLIENRKTSTTSQKNTIWYFVKEKAPYNILHLFNFLNNTSEDWRDDEGKKEKPVLQEDLVLKYYTEEKVTSVMVASPDFNHAGITKLSYVEGVDRNGAYVQITIPKLEYWDMILIKTIS